MNKVDKKIIILAKSDIGGRLCPTQHGEFLSESDAINYAKDKIKKIPYVIAEQTRHTDLAGKVQINYRHLTKVFNMGDDK